MIKRQIVSIDQQKCDGCGQCVPGCEEGAIRVVGGKARLVSDVYCDGLGACLGHCPQSAISVIERDAEPFNEAAVQARLARRPPPLPVLSHSGGCPGSQARSFQRPPQRETLQQHASDTQENPPPSGLANWPVQLRLVPPEAPYLQGADLLLVADCVPFAMADFHQRFLDGRPVVIGCPKLDDAQQHVHKLAQIIQVAAICSITVLQMEVPCCTALAQIARAAKDLAARDVPVEEIVVSLRGRSDGPGRPSMPIDRAKRIGSDPGDWRLSDTLPAT